MVLVNVGYLVQIDDNQLLKMKCFYKILIHFCCENIQIFLVNLDNLGQTDDNQ